MERLEKKLQELGYRFIEDYFTGGTQKFCQKEIVKNDVIIGIYTNKEKTKIEDYEVEGYICIDTQQQIDNLQQAFNEMQKDLAILKEIEKDELEL